MGCSSCLGVPGPMLSGGRRNKKKTAKKNRKSRISRRSRNRGKTAKRRN